jgi:thiol peroxidase
MAKITLKGTAFQTVGELPAVGAPAPDFHLVDGDLNDVRLEAFKGKRKILTINPSFDTAVCATAARKFNEQAAALDNGVVLAISADLPFAQKRFCTAEGLDHVIPLSMMRSKNFAKDYGVLIQDGPLAGVTARAIVVVNENDEVVHTQLVEEVTEEPDYAAALNSIR